MPDADLHGKRALIVGGETALGRALAVGLAEAGAGVAIVTLSPDSKAGFAVNSALNELWALDRRGIALAIDASEAAQMRDAVDRAERELGRLDLAAAVVPRGAPVRAPDEGAVALDALRTALDGRPVVVIAADADAAEALRAVRERF